MSAKDMARDVDVIVPLSYAITTNKDDRIPRLASGTIMSLRLAISLKKRFPEATLAFCNSSHSGLAGQGALESRLKTEILKSLGLRYTEVYGTNSIEEAEEICNLIEQGKIRTEERPRILVVCGEGHARRARLVWKHVFRRAFQDTEILFTCFPFKYEVDDDHAMPKQRNVWKWLFWTVAAYGAFRLFGVERFRKSSHSTD